MGDLFTTCFCPKGPSSGNTYIRITKKRQWVMGGTWDAWKCFTKLGVWCVRSVGCQIHSFAQQYHRGACATFVRRWHRRHWMNVRKSLGGNWCDGGVFIVKLNLDTIIVHSCVGQNLYLEVFRHLYSLCVTVTLTCTYLHTCVLCNLKNEAVDSFVPKFVLFFLRGWAKWKP